jgi:hypothetical protein
MKLLILLFTPFVCFGQITFTEKLSFNTQTTNATSFGTGATTFDAGKLYLFVAQTTGTTNPGTISSTSLTWTSVAAVGDATNRIQVFRCMPAAITEGETVTLGTFGGGSTGYSVVIYEITGVVTTGTNGANAIAQSVTQSATTGTNPAITLAALFSGSSAVMGIFSNNAEPFGGTSVGGWSEIQDVGYATPTTGYYETRDISTVDNTVSVTAASSTWIGIAIELKSSISTGFPLYFFTKSKHEKNSNTSRFTGIVK